MRNLLSKLAKALNLIKSDEPQIKAEPVAEIKTVTLEVKTAEIAALQKEIHAAKEITPITTTAQPSPVKAPQPIVQPIPIEVPKSFFAVEFTPKLYTLEPSANRKWYALVDADQTEDEDLNIKVHRQITRLIDESYKDLSTRLAVVIDLRKPRPYGTTMPDIEIADIDKSRSRFSYATFDGDEMEYDKTRGNVQSKFSSFRHVFDTLKDTESLDLNEPILYVQTSAYYFSDNFRKRSKLFSKNIAQFAQKNYDAPKLLKESVENKDDRKITPYERGYKLQKGMIGPSASQKAWYGYKSNMDGFVERADNSLLQHEVREELAGETLDAILYETDNDPNTIMMRDETEEDLEVIDMLSHHDTKAAHDFRKHANEGQRKLSKITRQNLKTGLRL